MPDLRESGLENCRFSKQGILLLFKVYELLALGGVRVSKTSFQRGGTALEEGELQLDSLRGKVWDSTEEPRNDGIKTLVCS